MAKPNYLQIFWILRDANNKKELFDFLSCKVSNHDYPSGKLVHITSGTININVYTIEHMPLLLYVGYI